jgi:dihydropteroate synthase-like protein
MMFLSKKRGSVPKDLGIDLLVLKDKRTHEESYDKALEINAEVFMAPEIAEPSALDTAGAFKINLDREKDIIIVTHYLTSDLNKPANIIKGKTADAIYAKIFKLGLVSKLDHAAYIGSELEKAQIALQTGKDYVQDSELFRK